MPELFDATDFATPPGIPRGETCTPAPIGSGPDGATCKSCAWFRRVPYHDKTFLKCGRMEFRWSHGEATDIRASWPACREFEAAHTEGTER